MTNRVHLITTSGRRGAEVQAASLVAGLREGGGADVLVALRAGTGPTVNADVLGHHRSRDPRTMVRLRRRVAAASVVIGHGGDTLSATGVAHLGTRTPFVYVTIGDPRFWRRSVRARTQARLLLRAPTMIVVLFPEAADALVAEGVRRDRIRLIPSGFDVTRFRLVDDHERTSARERLGLDPARPTVAFVGALSREKAPTRAIAALPPGAQLVIAGSGPLLDEVRSAATQSLGPVHLLGFVEDPRVVYRAADAVVVPSDTEGLPAVAVEASLSGVPVVASSVGGLASVVVDGESGRLVAPGDIDGLRVGLEEALRRRDEWGARARALAVDRFGLGGWLDRWSELLERVEHDASGPS